MRCGLLTYTQRCHEPKKGMHQPRDSAIFSENTSKSTSTSTTASQTLIYTQPYPKERIPRTSTGGGWSSPHCGHAPPPPPPCPLSSSPLVSASAWFPGSSSVVDLSAWRCHVIVRRILTPLHLINNINTRYTRVSLTNMFEAQPADDEARGLGEQEAESTGFRARRLRPRRIEVPPERALRREREEAAELPQEARGAAAPPEAFPALQPLLNERRGVSAAKFVIVVGRLIHRRNHPLVIQSNQR